ncbi:hypothetical protein G4B88_002225 [Cannabis sativa]|uniref:Hyccin n=1 Tax=Cannabis sativa TaxID=3483 RepID=A0A7J6FYW0_CANSA|nr:hypothetical protein G4B88_002225 [Cannabis sativa]
MDFRNSPSSSTTSSTTTTPNPAITTATGTGPASSDDPMHSWWESISKARSRIHSLSSILDPTSTSSSFSLSSLADSDRPALSLLSSIDAYLAISAALSSPLSGSGSDPLCHWLYDTYLSSDPHLRLVVFSFIPLLSGLYLSRIHSLSSDSPSIPSLAGFEAVLLALYAAETKVRAGKPVLVSVPDLSQPSLYHTPRQKPNSNPGSGHTRNSIGVLAPPLEPQVAVKSTKRAGIVGVALDCYYKQISQMPAWSKLDFCRFSAAWAGRDCSCQEQFDDEPEITGILGHCLLAPLNSQDVKDEAAFAVRRLYARASHDLLPQAILATRSLIQLDKRARADAKAAAAATNSSSNANTPSKARKPEVLLVSKTEKMFAFSGIQVYNVYLSLWGSSYYIIRN